LHNNFIRKITGLEGKDKLSFLDLTHNWLNDWEQVDSLKTMLPSLREFGMRCNPIATKKSYRAQVFTRLPNL